jgi:hypothetical protein
MGIFVWKIKTGYSVNGDGLDRGSPNKDGIRFLFSEYPKIAR